MCDNVRFANTQDSTKRFYFAVVLLAVPIICGCGPSEGPTETSPASTVGDETDASSEAEQATLTTEPVANDDLAERIETLEALGYVSGLVPANREWTGVVKYDRTRTYDGLNIVNSSHAPEAILMDMNGEPLHRWRFLMHDVWPNVNRPEMKGWRRVRITEEGDLFAVYSSGVGLIKIDKNSNLIWQNQDNHHHDLEILDDGSILGLTRTVHIVPRINKKYPILEDFIVVHAPDGRQIQKVSLLECVENSMYWPVFADIFTKTKPDGNIFHTNDVEMLDGRFADRNPAFAKGNVMVSILMMSAIAIIDLDQRKIVWLDTGMWLHQHNPSVLDNGNILLFDNQGRRGLSQVIEFNPMTQLVEWLYPPANDAESYPALYSEHLSTAQRLPNGNTLIVESYNGRSIEVTQDHDIVWEYLNPNRTGENKDLIANLQQVVRLPPDFPTDWADSTTLDGPQ